ncbi:uncharacterized protein LOC134221391 [Armigeres subalbatus]|uniref:uncharacterized protein LOC134221391 n=1 Tax=Armigeres subalbatus TaxID=124917 RepID=UPI002ED56F4C
MPPGVKNPDTGDPNQKRKVYEKFEYTKNDKGPYRLIAELIDDQKGEIRINKLTVGKLLCKSKEYKDNIINMRPMGQKRLLVFVKSYTIANRLQEDETMKGNNYSFYVPRNFLTITGVVSGVPVEMSNEEIMENMTCEVPIVNIYRLHRFVNNMKIPTNRISIMFRTSQLPAEVKLYCCNNSVQPFISKPVLCENCLRYGHKTETCRSKKRCPVCATHHEGVETGDCNNKNACLYCKRDHRTNDPNCPEREKQRNIKKIMAKSNMNYLEAREINPIMTQNRYDILENLADFPTPSESFATMTAGNYKPKDPQQYKPQAVQKVKERSKKSTLLTQ